jgi:hypothetical protein
LLERQATSRVGNEEGAIVEAHAFLSDEETLEQIVLKPEERR